MNRKSICYKLLAVLLCTTFLFGCAANAASQTGTVSQSSVADQGSSNNVEVENISAAISKLVTYDEDDYYADWKNEDPNYI